MYYLLQRCSNRYRDKLTVALYIQFVQVVGKWKVVGGGEGTVLYIGRVRGGERGRAGGWGVENYVINIRSKVRLRSY